MSLSTTDFTGNNTEKVTKNLDPDKAHGHDMINTRKYNPLTFILDHLIHEQQIYF